VTIVHADTEFRSAGTRLRLQDLHVAFDGADVLHLDELNIQPGEWVTLVGPSGCGKSTLLRVIAGLLSPTSGRVEIACGDEYGGRDVRTGFVFQDATLLPWRTAFENIRLPGELEGQSVPAERVHELAQLVGLTQVDLQKRPAALSGGMKMRVSLARALSLEPGLLLLDEPFAALDDLLRQQLQADVREIQQQLGITTVLVTHNVSEAVFLSDRVWTLGGSPASITSETSIQLRRDETARGSVEFARHMESVLQALRSCGGHRDG